ncbi:MAG: hypothetical protein KGL39_11725 [Patescibacteria group bacterium]|nr:hypothetical protein [Patescibacteria group bacterium]
MSPHQEQAKIGYVFNLVTNIDEGQQLTISGNLALGATKEEMGAEFDKLLSVTGRLAAKHKALKKKAEIADGEAMINSMKADLQQLDETKEGHKLNIQERNNREAMLRNIRHVEGKVAAHKTELEALEAQAA